MSEWLTDDEFQRVYECTARAVPVSRELRIRAMEELRQRRRSDREIRRMTDVCLGYRVITERNEARHKLATLAEEHTALEAERRVLTEIRRLAALVVRENRIKILHARASSAMCKLARALAAGGKEAP